MKVSTVPVKKVNCVLHTSFGEHLDFFQIMMGFEFKGFLFLFCLFANKSHVILN